MKKVIFLSLLMLLAVVTSCSKENVDPSEIEDCPTEMEEPQPCPDEDFCKDCAGCPSCVGVGWWPPPEFSVEVVSGEVEVFENRPGFVDAGIGAEGGVIILTHIGGVGWGVTTRYIWFNERFLITQSQIEWEKWIYEKATGNQLPEDHFADALIVTTNVIATILNPNPFVSKIESEDFIITVIFDNENDDPALLMIEMFPNTTSEENELWIGLFAGNTSGSIRITQSAE